MPIIEKRFNVAVLCFSCGEQMKVEKKQRGNFDTIIHCENSECEIVGKEWRYANGIGIREEGEIEPEPPAPDNIRCGNAPWNRRDGV